MLIRACTVLEFAGDSPTLVPVNFCKDGRVDVAVNDKLSPNFRKNWGQRNEPQVFLSITDR